VEAFLIDEWMGVDEAIPIADEASVSEARQLARKVAAEQQLDSIDAERLATLASELAWNQLKHARRGQIAVRPIARAGRRGVEIIAADEGNGITDPTQALRGAPRATGSLGVGLAAVREHAHEVDFDVRLEEGTCIRARRFDGEVPRRREIGVFGRPFLGEPRSGDHARIFRSEERLLIGICDGLGHGPHARAAASAAMSVLADHRVATPMTIVEECHRALGPTRGAVMAVAAVGEGEGSTLELASVGNITVELLRPRATRRFGASSFVLGSSQRGWRANGETAVIDDDETLLLFTDGIASRASIADDLVLLREHPVVIAHQLALRFGRPDDDLLVVVAR
jgi:anti-sigma regulatory factor (Ser/Thr protein kinase)